MQPENNTENETQVNDNIETTEPVIEPEATIEELQARINELEGQLKDEQLRALATEQNLRRRHQEEIENTHKFAGQKFASAMLPVKDYLEMALRDQGGNFVALKMGVQRTLTRITSGDGNRSQSS